MAKSSARTSLSPSARRTPAGRAGVMSRIAAAARRNPLKAAAVAGVLMVGGAAAFAKARQMGLGDVTLEKLRVLKASMSNEMRLYWAKRMLSQQNEYLKMGEEFERLSNKYKFSPRTQNRFDKHAAERAGPALAKAVHQAYTSFFATP